MRNKTLAAIMIQAGNPINHDSVLPHAETLIRACGDDPNAEVSVTINVINVKQDNVWAPNVLDGRSISTILKDETKKLGKVPVWGRLKESVRGLLK